MGRRLRCLHCHLVSTPSTYSRTYPSVAGDVGSSDSDACAIVPHTSVGAAVAAFRRHGFVLLGEALPPSSVAQLQGACAAVFDEVAAFDTERRGSRGAARYGLGALTARDEWAQLLIDNPRVTPVLDAIWGHEQCQLLRCGMNGSFPGCADQPLHIDIRADTFGDGTAGEDDAAPVLPIQRMPLFSLTVHYPVVDLCDVNGTIRFVPGSQRWATRPPSLDAEGRGGAPGAAALATLVRCPRGTAIVNDIRCWHGGCRNTATAERYPSLGVGANHARPMPNAQFNAPWFMRPGDNHRHLPRRLFDTLSARGRHLSRSVVLPAGAPEVHPLAHGLSQIGFLEETEEEEEKQWAGRSTAEVGSQAEEARRIVSTLANRI
jgi:hypothetical protein